MLAVISNLASRVAPEYQDGRKKREHKFAFHLPELLVLPAVNDDVAAGVEDKEKVRDQGQEVAPFNISQ